jgi:ABC-type sulfate transport system permease subunit
MVSLVIEYALFFLVLFFLVPALMVFAISMRNAIHDNLKDSAWHHKEATGKSAG